jgi:hypothetical protein
MSYVLPVVARLTGQPPVSQSGECLEHHRPLPQITNRITNVTACHLGEAVRAHEWVAGYADWHLTDTKRLSNSKVASVRN